MSLRPLRLRPVPGYGALVTLDTFVEWVEKGVVTDKDGTGYFATSTEFSDIVARPSTLRHGFPMHHTGEFTHVVWFNK